MTIKKIDEWGKHGEPSYKLMESLEKGVVIERWLEILDWEPDAHWIECEDSEVAYPILRDRLAELTKQAVKKVWIQQEDTSFVNQVSLTKGKDQRGYFWQEFEVEEEGR